MGRGLTDLLGEPAPQIAAQLLGCLLVHGEVVVELTEVEAYAGVGEDPASHAHRGLTPRTRTMFGAPGHAYVYLSYGVHRCLNIVTGPVGTASAVLVRGARVLAGLELARDRRRGIPDARLARGPGCLTRALDIGLGDDGLDLLRGPGVRLEPGTAPAQVACGPRIGITKATELPWRWWVPGADGVTPAARMTPRGAPEL
jgi:DNA-3-methyladenine glycosylase